MFEQFKKSIVKCDDVHINFIIGGSGPPLLLLHGYPQSHVMWHKIAPKLMDQYTVVISDLRGYGDSSKPKTTETHEPYSKRSMARDQIQLMDQLGFESFFLVGHDRGGRVAHRLTMDYPDVVKKLVLLDIAPTYSMYMTTDIEFAKAYYHWFFLIQPFDFPERMIGSNAEYFIRQKFRQWGRDSEAFTEEAMDEYIRCFTPEMIHASCEDYRASATIDLIHDQVDIDMRNKMSCPVLALWGSKGFVGNKYNIISEWSKWATDVRGRALTCGHYPAEEAPHETLVALVDFLQDKNEKI